MKRENNNKNENENENADIVYTTIMIRHKDKLMSGFIIKRESSDSMFVEGYEYVNGSIKRFKTPDMTMDELKAEWIIVEDLRSE